MKLNSKLFDLSPCLHAILHVSDLFKRKILRVSVLRPARAFFDTQDFVLVFHVDSKYMFDIDSDSDRKGCRPITNFQYFKQF